MSFKDKFMEWTKNLAEKRAVEKEIKAAEQEAYNKAALEVRPIEAAEKAKARSEHRTKMLKEKLKQQRKVAKQPKPQNTGSGMLGDMNFISAKGENDIFGDMGISSRRK